MTDNCQPPAAMILIIREQIDADPKMGQVAMMMYLLRCGRFTSRELNAHFDAAWSAAHA